MVNEYRKEKNDDVNVDMAKLIKNGMFKPSKKENSKKENSKKELQELENRLKKLIDKIPLDDESDEDISLSDDEDVLYVSEKTKFM